MSWTLGFWIGAAVLLFWAVGAYNRLIRLRAAALQAFVALEARLREQTELVQACLPPSAVPQAAQEDDLLDDMASLWNGLGGAAAQFNASLAAARARPLDAEAIAALQAAQGVLYMAWHRLQQDDAHDLAGAALPETLQLRWQQIEAHVQSDAALFRQQVETYNDAIAQFPALVLARLFSLRPARPL
ncbi:MAG: LemA family protein [Pseudomonadota bacterium]